MRSIQRTISFLVAVFALMPAFVLMAQMADQDMAGAYNKASNLYDQGAYAEAREVLAEALNGAPADADTKRAKSLATRVDNALEDIYSEQMKARERAVAQAEKDARREEARNEHYAKVSAEIAKLMDSAKATDQAAKYEEASRLSAKLAEERAIDAYDRAMDFFEQGEFDKARIVFENLQKWVDEQKSVDEDVRLSLGKTRTENVAKYLSQIDQAKRNSEAGMQVFQARARTRIEQAESEKRLRATLRSFNQAVMAFDKNQMAEAKRLFMEVDQSSADIGKARRKETASYLAQITEVEKEIAERRSAALRNMEYGEKMLGRGDWKGSIEFLNRTRQEEDVLLPDEVQKLADLMAAADKAGTEATTMEGLPAGMTPGDHAAAEDYITRARQLIKVLREQNEALAHERVLLAKEEYANLNYEGALQYAEAALQVMPDNEEAIKLRADLRAILKKDMPPSDIASALRVRVEQVVGEMNRAIDRGRMYKDTGEYGKALEQFDSATEALDFVRPTYDVRNIESQLDGLIEETKKSKAEADAALAAEREFTAANQANAAVADRRMMAERRIMGLLQVANDEFARGKYEAAIQAAESVLELQPNSIAAKELIDQAERALRRRSWTAISEADKRNRENESVRIAARLIWPGSTVEFPAKAVWEMISDRDRVDAIAAEARPMSDQEILHNEALDKRIEAFSFEEIPLDEVINFFKLLPQFQDINIVVDDQALGDREIFITRTMNNVTLRQALSAMLTPLQLQFIVVNDSIFISDAAGIRRIEANDEDLYFYQYDVSDLLISLDGDSGGNDSGNNSDSDSDSNSDDSGNDSGNDGGGDATAELLDLIRLFTGGNSQWDVIGSMGGSSDEGNEDEEDSGGGFGGGGGGLGGLGGGGGVAGLGGMEEARRIAILRQGYLMVQHVDRIHQAIQQLLARLRAQIAIQVDVEGRYITYTDLFYKDFRISWENIDFNLGSKLGFVPASNWTVSSINPLSYASSYGLSTQMLEMNVQFMNSAQTAAVIRAVKNSQHATQVTAPHVLCLNTQTQEISLTRTASYVRDYTIDDGFAIPNIETYEVASTTLEVTPVVSADRRFVTMDVNIEITSQALASRDVPVAIRSEGGNNSSSTAGNVTVTIDIPEEDSNDMQSTVRVPDRGTVVLGGLASTAETKGQGSIPVLCHIPILKRLVTSDAVGKQRVHTIFLVTPTIMLNEEIEP